MNRNFNIVIYIFTVEGGTLSIWKRRNPLRGVRMGDRLQNISPRGALHPAHRFRSSDGGRKGAEQGLSFRDTVSQAALLNGLHSLHRSVRGEAPQPNEFQLERVKRKI